MDTISTVTTLTTTTPVVTLNAAELSTKEINQALRALPDGATVTITIDGIGTLSNTLAAAVREVAL